MNVDKFFNDLNEKTWRDNKRFHAERRFDTLMKHLEESKDEIIDNIVSDVEKMEHIKNEDQEVFKYEMFEEWLGRLSVSNIVEWIDED